MEVMAGCQRYCLLTAHPVADSGSVRETCLKTIIIYIVVLNLEQDWILCIRL